MARDRRYKIVKTLMEAGELTDFRSIFLYIPKKVVYQDMGMNYNRFKRLLFNPDLFSFRELITLSSLIGVENRIIIDLAYAQYEMDKKNRDRKSRKSEYNDTRQNINGHSQ